MADMPIPSACLPDLEPRTFLTLGLRSWWLHEHLTINGSFMSPRDRDILTCVATSLTGLSRPELLDRMRVLGVAVELMARLELNRLVAQGWLSVHERDGLDWFDLPREDTAWIANKVALLTGAR